ncbi:VOC family protein [Haloplanus sp. GCM10025708]|uniref:VOC family protein n=1 Tax=Haloplanus sp. GCM10025708 TaxID=3252679 RepID=UPI003614ADA5
MCALPTRDGARIYLPECEPTPWTSSTPPSGYRTSNAATTSTSRGWGRGEPPVRPRRRREHLRRRRPRRDTVALRRVERGVDPDRETLDHVALGVDDVDATFDRVRAETGCPVVEEPFTVDQAGARVAFVEDPDGYVIEFVEQL